jgi:Spy/CpxP family protein refolding chaperone
VTKRFVTVFICLALAAPVVFGQRPQARTASTPAQAAANRVARLTTLLTLSSGQQAEATRIFTAEQTAVAGLGASMRTARTALQTAVQSNNLAEINTAAATIGTLTTTEAAAHATANAAFYAQLTPAQQAQYKQLGGLREAGGLGAGGFGGRDRRH